MRLEQAAFLVGGRGTRLGALTATTAKPLLDVGKRPFLDYLLENVVRFGIRKFILLAGYLGEDVERRYRDWGGDRGFRIDCVVEKEASGTGGALRHAANLFDAEFLLCNGDTFFDFNYLDLATMEAGDKWLAKMALRRVADASRYGNARVDGNRVTDFVPGERGGGLVNGGVYVLRRGILDVLPQSPVSLEQEIFPLLAAGGRLFGKEYGGYFVDIGIAEDLARARSELASRLRRPAAFLDRDGILNHDKGYVFRKQDFVWCDGAIEAVKGLNDRGYFVVVVTNQAGVAHGYYEEADIGELHRWMAQELAERGAHIDAFYYCPHHAEGTKAPYAVACDCRKPKPGMLLQAMDDWPIVREESFLIGDKATDIAAAEAAGVRGILWSASGNDLRDAIDLATGGKEYRRG